MPRGLRHVALSISFFSPIGAFSSWAICQMRQRRLRCVDERLTADLRRDVQPRMLVCHLALRARPDIRPAAIVRDRPHCGERCRSHRAGAAIGAATAGAASSELTGGGPEWISLPCLPQTWQLGEPDGVLSAKHLGEPPLASTGSKSRRSSTRHETMVLRIGPSLQIALAADSKCLA